MNMNKLNFNCITKHKMEFNLADLMLIYV